MAASTALPTVIRSAAVHVYLLFSAPLAYAYVLVLRDDAGQGASLTIASFVRGAVAYLFVVPVLLLIERFVSIPYSGTRLLFYAGVVDLFLPLSIGCLLHLWFTPSARDLPPRERLVSLYSFLFGEMTLAGILDLFMRARYFGEYELFLLPTIRVAAVLLVSTLIYRFGDETFRVRYLYLVVACLLPVALGAVYLLAVMNYPLPAGLAAGASLVGGFAAVTLAAGIKLRGLRLR